MSGDDTYLVDILESAKIALEYVAGNDTKQTAAGGVRIIRNRSS